ncbi:MAG: MotA/TolQ/ExbB proton channel family protein [Saccharospirillaceae bacterium]|nr:MotA/TolQ/ExbB proton channel family protein [Pseudomonadales bacterium]NRB79594.1 MotA/TolQ/ExbB proton channel family protein [Saccharospirillaceae bacterium]
MPLISTLFGFIGASLLFMYAITTSTDSYSMFLSPSSLLLVLGGTFAATIISYNLWDVFKAIACMAKTLSDDKDSNRVLNKDVKKIIEWSKIYRKKGLGSWLEVLSAKDKKDKFLTYCFEMIQTGYSIEECRYLISARIEADFTRKAHPAKILQTMANFAPGFGMVGTIIGLIIMLDTMGGDISALGKGLALALITTLYGVLLGQLVFKPCSTHLFNKVEGEYFRHQVILEGIICVLQKRDSIAIQDHINALLRPKAYFQLSNNKD